MVQRFFLLGISVTPTLNHRKVQERTVQDNTGSKFASSYTLRGGGGIVFSQYHMPPSEDRSGNSTSSPFINYGRFMRTENTIGSRITSEALGKMVRTRTMVVRFKVDTIGAVAMDTRYKAVRWEKSIYTTVSMAV